VTIQDHDSHTLQAVVDRLSVSLDRPVLLDDAAMVPLAYSRQGREIDGVRSASILNRGPTRAVRETLLSAGISDSDDVVRIAAEPELEMVERVCVPVRAGDRAFGYLWLLDADRSLTDAEVELARDAARRIATILDVPKAAGESALIERLISDSSSARERGVLELRERRLLGEEVALIVLADTQTTRTDRAAAVAAIQRRLSQRHSIASESGEQTVMLLSLGEPALRSAGLDGLAAWLSGAVAGLAAVGVSDRSDPFELHRAHHQAQIALRVAKRSADGVACWVSLGANRVVEQLPDTLVFDLPPGLRRLAVEEPDLMDTLAIYLDAAGDVKAATGALALHRSGLYYRLRRIEDLTGLDLADGDDRLIAHLAVRILARG
jgi:DNA-binding PucR family transcriptional regulator